VWLAIVATTNSVVVQVDTEVGPVSIVAPAARFNKQERTFGPVPAVGAHTDAIKAEFGL
jgi:crotonobetainyl-CoA:carnitine CoA-transferase CaiB-like acyl-CoA transferase